MLFTSAILAFVTFSNAIQVAIPVDAFNQKLIESLPQINSILSKKLIQLDPIPDSGSGSASSSQGMLFCTARVSADFHLKNLRGISGVSVSLFQISSIVADQGTGSFTVAFTLKTNRVDLLAVFIINLRISMEECLQVVVKYTIVQE